MNIEELTIKQIREIASMVNCGVVPEQSKQHPFVGKYVLCRCYSAGVHVGELISLDGDLAVLKNSRRLWSWKAKSGVALSGVAQNGLDKGCKVDSVNPEIYLSGVIEVIPCSTVSKEIINDY